MIKYCCTNGEAVSQSTINRRYSEALKTKHSGQGITMCECCRKERAQDNDHTISQKRCKEIGKTELIYDPENFVSSCRSCHNSWESYKSDEFRHHLNYEERMNYLHKHDLQSYFKRA